MYRGMVCRVELSIINMKIEPRPTVEALITIYVNADRYHTSTVRSNGCMQRIAGTPSKKGKPGPWRGSLAGAVASEFRSAGCHGFWLVHGC